MQPFVCLGPLQAFQALATCAKVLQDKDLRAKLDARREDAALRKMAQEAAAAQERERAWRVARGEELPDAGAQVWHVNFVHTSSCVGSAERRSGNVL